MVRDVRFSSLTWNCPGIFLWSWHQSSLPAFFLYSVSACCAFSLSPTIFRSTYFDIRLEWGLSFSAYTNRSVVSTRHSQIRQLTITVGRKWGNVVLLWSTQKVMLSQIKLRNNTFLFCFLKPQSFLIFILDSDDGADMELLPHYHTLLLQNSQLTHKCQKHNRKVDDLLHCI